MTDLHGACLLWLMSWLGAALALHATLAVAVNQNDPETMRQQLATAAGSQNWGHRRLLKDYLVVRTNPSSKAAAAGGPVRAALGASHPSITPFSMTCTAAALSKQSCLFTNVCLQPSRDGESITAYLHGTQQTQHAALLKQHLDVVLQGLYKKITCKVVPSSKTSSSSIGSNSDDSSNPAGSSSGSSTSRIIVSRSMALKSINTTQFDIEHDVTMLWQLTPENQGSFGHALINFALPMFMVLQNHFGSDIPTHLQLLVTKTWHPVLQHVVTGTITRNAQLLADKLAALSNSFGVVEGSRGLCFKQLVVGDGGYVQASRASLANSREPEAHTYSTMPSFFDSSNWWAFRRQSLQVNGVVEGQGLGTSRTRPLILLNDKRHGPNAELDRRMILEIDDVAANIRAAYPNAEALSVRFRDLDWPDQLRLLSTASVFITTQGSSAFRLVFLPKGATCIVIGAPEKRHVYTEWTNFHELDRWFPLSYVQFERYEVPFENKDEYEVKVMPGWWQPAWWHPAERKRWWLYNANVRLDMERLKQYLDLALAVP